MVKTDVGERPFKVFYAPVIWLHNHTFMKQPMEWYAKLWGWH